MRFLSAALVVAGSLLAISDGHAEKRVFIVSANIDGYGVDRCLAAGESCGAAVAAAYCERKQFATAASYRKVERDEITGAIPASEADACRGGICEAFVAIECAR